MCKGTKLEDNFNFLDKDKYNVHSCDSTIPDETYLSNFENNVYESLRKRATQNDNTSPSNKSIVQQN